MKKLLYFKVIAGAALVSMCIGLGGCGAGGRVGLETQEASVGQGGTGQRSGPEDGPGEQEGASSGSEGEAGEVTSLSLMQAYNQTPEQVIEDKYRSFYEIFVYSFYDSNGDGIGDLKGVTEKLDYVNDGDSSTDTDLGCNGIWLMPVMPSASYHKYDVKDYLAIDPEYGTMEDFDGLLSACKERGIHVILDLVMNHTSSQHEWFQKACQYLQQLGDKEPDPAECPYVEYYNFSKEKVSDVYYQVPGTDWYYEGSFWSEMPDLDLLNEKVRDEFSKITKFWLDKGVAGFRVDAAKEFESDNTPANVEILSWLNTTVKSVKADGYIVAEVWTDMDTYEKYYESGIDSVFNFAFAQQDGVIAKALNKTNAAGAVSYGKALALLEQRFLAYNPDYIDAPFYANHDNARSAGYYSGEGSTEKTKLAHAMNLMMSGSTFLYYGEELGMKGSGKDENKRAPMYWMEDASGKGMCQGPADMESIKMKFPSLEVQQEDGNSVYQFVKEALHLRNSYPVIARGSVFCLEELSGENICVIKKEYEGRELLIMFNMGEAAENVSLKGITLNEKDAGESRTAGALLTGTEDVKVVSGEVTLPPYSCVLFQ